MRVNAMMEDPVARNMFSSLRTQYQRLRQEAKKAVKVKRYEIFLRECCGDPRVLWRRINGKANAPCPISDVSSWKE